MRIVDLLESARAPVWKKLARAIPHELPNVILKVAYSDSATRVKEALEILKGYTSSLPITNYGDLDYQSVRNTGKYPINLGVVKQFISLYGVALIKIDEMELVLVPVYRDNNLLHFATVPTKVSADKYEDFISELIKSNTPDRLRPNTALPDIFTVAFTLKETNLVDIPNKMLSAFLSALAVLASRHTDFVNDVWRQLRELHPKAYINLTTFERGKVGLKVLIHSKAELETDVYYKFGASSFVPVQFDLYVPHKIAGVPVYGDARELAAAINKQVKAFSSAENSAKRLWKRAVENLPEIGEDYMGNLRIGQSKFTESIKVSSDFPLRLIFTSKNAGWLKGQVFQTGQKVFGVKYGLQVTLTDHGKSGTYISLDIPTDYFTSDVYTKPRKEFKAAREKFLATLERAIPDFIQELGGSL